MKFPCSFWGNSAGTVIAKRSVATDPHAAIKVATASTVDWGDGTPLEAATANVQLNHVYTALGEMTVTITAAAPHAMDPDLSVKHPASTAVDAGWTDITLYTPSSTKFTIKPNSVLKTFRILGDSKWTPPPAADQINRIPSLEEIEIHQFIGPNNPSCVDNTNLKRFICHTPEGTGVGGGFARVKSLELVDWDISGQPNLNQMYIDAHLAFNPVHDIRDAVNINEMFTRATGVTSVTLTNARKVTNADNAFRSQSLVTVNRMDFDALKSAVGMCMAPSMVHHPGWNGELVQDIGYLFWNCASLETVGDIGMANVTGTTQAFDGCPKLRSLTLRGLKVSVSIKSLSLDATALDAVFTSLGTANAGAIINITGNPGAATCNKAIAIAKSWAVTG